MAFAEVHAITNVMINFEAPWCIGGEWAIALRVGRERRSRGNVEFVVFREDSRALREHLADWTLVADYGHVKSEWEPGEPVPPGVTTVLATSPDGICASIRIFETAHGLWFSSLNRAINRSVNGLLYHTRDSIPYLVPEVALLGLAPGSGPDQLTDLRAAMPFLDGMAKLWLDRALSMTMPDHEWRSVLDPSRAPVPAPPCEPPPEAPPEAEDFEAIQDDSEE